MLNTEKVAAARKKAGLSLAQAAEKAGLSNRQQWHLIESGQRSNIKLDTLDKIAAALGVKAKDLLK